MPLINIKYFASLREKAGLEMERMEVNVRTYGELYQLLDSRYQFGLPSEMIQVAVNDEFSSMQETILPEAKIVFIPPVAGG